MTTTNTFVGIGEAQRVSSRVLKPPGGGSSISFGEDVNLADHIRRKQVAVVSPTKPTAPAPVSPPKTEEPKEQPKAPENNGMPIPESNSMPTPPPESNVSASTPETSPPESNVSASTPETCTTAPAENGSTTTPQSPSNSTATKVDDFPTPAAVINGTNSPPVTNGTNKITNGTSSGSSTPNCRATTQNRLFGEEARKDNRPYRIRDHQKSSIFGDDGGSHPVVSPKSAPQTPEPKIPEPQQQPPQQKQRVPPGGFSTKLW